MLADFAAVVESLEFGEPVLSAVSTVTGEPVTPGLWSDPSYWVGQVRQTVRFGDAVVALEGLGVSGLLELGPDAALTGVAQEIVGSDVVTVAAQRRDRDEVESWLTALARLHVSGTPVQWPSTAAPELDLPTYPFQHQHYWLKPAETASPVHHFAWEPVTSSPAPSLAGRWLLAMPEQARAGVAAGVVRALVEHGAEAVPVTLSDLDRAALADRLRVEADGISGVISLLALDERDSRGAAGTALLVQALNDAGVAAPLWCLTAGAVAATPDDDLPGAIQAQVWGVGRTVAAEHPQLWGGLVDLPADLDESARGHLAAILAGALLNGREDELAIREAGAYARRLTTGRPGPVPVWRPRGTVLITGGTGALGATVARHLAERGAAHLVLMSRRGPDAPGADELTRDLRERGCQVTVVAGDVADEQALAAVLADIPADAPLTAVVHAAGALDDGVLDALTPQRFATVFHGKVLAAYHLDRLTAELDLDAFVLFSSMAGSLGAAGQGSYAAANACLDALAERRRAEGLPATSIAWGPWDGTGMAAERPEMRRRLQGAGIRLLDPQAALAVLDGVALGAEPTTLVADVNWQRYASGAPNAAARSVFADLAPAPAEDPDVRPAVDDFAARLRALPRAEAARVVSDLVRTQVAAVLGHEDTASVHESRSFTDSGFTSLMAVELRNRLGAATGLSLSATLVFDFPTPVLLAEHVCDQLLGSVSSADSAPVPATVASTGDDPVVIVGLGCRFPGGVVSGEGLWDVVAGGVDCVGPVPAGRGFGGVVGGFLDEAGGFDAGFFGISPREALAMDPQQRLLLEVSWEALEGAGVDPLSVGGDRVGVFVGTNGQDYVSLMRGGLGVEGFVGTGSAAAVLSGRVSYVLGLTGPSVTVDTACSSSLVALHLAVQSLRVGECDMALAGGVTVMSTAGAFVEFGVQGGLSGDGRCKAFGDGADGVGWGEGVGVLVVERLSDARRLGHRVLAVVRGSAVNQDGASNGLTAPNGPSQERVIRAALANAGLSAGDVDVVEAHGTGTRLGDPIEAGALLATYGQGRPVGRPLWLGSVKSNFGHTQAAAGVAGLIKMVMAMRAGVLPPTLHVGEPSSHVDWASGQVRLLREGREWVGGGLRRAGVSSFGISGTNAHVILEEPAGVEVPVEGVSVGGVPVAVVVSGWPWGSLRGLAGSVVGVLESGVGVGDVARALVGGRALLPLRAVVVSGDVVEGLRGLVEGVEVPGVVVGEALPTVSRLGVVFTGQGAQRVGMGAGLAAVFPVFAGALDEVCGLFGSGLREVIESGVGLERTGWAQPALFAVEVALWRLLESFGVRPSVVAGHSIGEVVAAHVAGVFSLSDAVRLVAARSSLMEALPEGGAMVAVNVSEDAALRVLPGGIAAVNGPSSVVLSGVEGEVLAAVEALGEVRSRRLVVSHAFHSVLMEPMLAEFAAVVESLEFGEPVLSAVSTVTGEPVTPGLWTDPSYWVGQVRQTVRFGDAVVALEGLGVTGLLELGPDAALTGVAQEIVGSDVVTVAAQRRDRDEVESWLTALARLHVTGTPVQWFTGGHRHVDLPTYPFDHQNYWPEIEPETADTSAWTYANDWQHVELPQTGLTGTWLVALPADLPGTQRPLVAAVTMALARAGADIVAVDLGTGLDRTAMTARLTERLAAHDGPAPVGVLSLLALAPGDGVAAPGLAATLVLLQALGDARVSARLWCVTRAAVATGPQDPGGSDQEQLWGFGRTAAAEYPQRWGGLLDLPSVDGTADPALIPGVLAGDEDEVALRADGVYTRRLRRREDVATDWEPRGTVLITGGTGALGGQVTRWLLTNGAQRVVAVSRHGGEASGTAELAAEFGSRLEIVAADVTDRAAMAALLDAHAPTAVVHAAGLLDDAVIDSLTPARLDTVLAAKVTGAAILDELTRDRQLDAFVLFSSLAGTFGSAGQANYAAANAGLDAIARQRLRSGHRAVSIAWGPWAGAGMAKDGAAERMRRAGVRPLPAEAALRLITAAGDAGGTLVVVDVDWPRYLPGLTATRRRPLFDELSEAEGLAPESAPPVLDLRAHLATLSESGVRQTLTSLVNSNVAAVLGHRDATVIDPNRPFSEIGFTSLSAVELRNALNTACGIALPAGLIFDYPTPSALVEHLRRELVGEPLSPVERLMADLDRLEKELVDEDRVAVAKQLATVIGRWNSAGNADGVADRIGTATDDEMFELLGKEFGIS
ncbi:hypothetical protein GCM10023322_84110 [Rugosimonospora acidiphila]|uniref:Acyl transferase domain-containing protein n=1 Tax=Rugosimonospora acidiphila TaxID=556531 RepID=A0ABP9SW27_9ACTN